MKYQPTDVEGAFVVSLEPRGDERGFFARVFCGEEFLRQGLDGTVSQVNTSASAQAGTLRGMHYQVAPYGEAKLVKCIRGAVFDVVLDLREGSPTFGRWAAAALTPENRLMLYAPKGCAHGFLTLEDDTEMLYTASSPYQGPAERVVRWNDPKFAIGWPRDPSVLSPKDQDAGDYDPALHRSGY